MITLVELLLILQRAKRGQFSVVFKIFEYLPEAKEAKAHLDYVIDLCGEPPKGKLLYATCFSLEYQINMVLLSNMMNMQLY